MPTQASTWLMLPRSLLNIHIQRSMVPTPAVMEGRKKAVRKIAMPRILRFSRTASSSEAAMLKGMASIMKTVL